MIHPMTQTNVGNAVLLAVIADASSGSIRLHFDRDIILRSEQVPLVITSGYNSAADALWQREAPGVLIADSPVEFGSGMPIGCYIPEGLTQIASSTGGRVLSALVWGTAL